MSQQTTHQDLKPLKPWLSYEAQLAQLRERGLQVDDEAAALNYLARLGYYRLSGYWYPMRAVALQASAQQGRAVRSDRFVPGSHFQSVVQLYVFDKKLRLLALDALERIEMAVRVDVAHVLGQRDPLAHLKPTHLHGNFTKKVMAKGPGAGKTLHQLWLEKFQQLQAQARKQPLVEPERAGAVALAPRVARTTEAGAAIFLLLLDAALAGPDLPQLHLGRTAGAVVGRGLCSKRRRAYWRCQILACTLAGRRGLCGRRYEGHK